MMSWLRNNALLKRNGVLGINGRNAEYLLPNNPRDCYPLVDDKFLTKQLAAKAGVAVPELYGVIEIQQQVRSLPQLLATRDDFVVKPARGSQGDGIIVVTGRAGTLYRAADGSLLDDHHLSFHVSNILSGVYSLGGQTDKALIEYRVQFDPVFEAITYRGVPDIRIIVFLGVPVMAMVRLPTRLSGGKANLHQGAIGTGVDMATGHDADRGVANRAGGSASRHRQSGVGRADSALGHADRTGGAQLRDDGPRLSGHRHRARS